MKVVFWGVVVATAGDPITNAYMIGQVFAGFLIDVAGELMRFMAGRAGVAVGFAFVFFQMIAVVCHFYMD